MKNKSIITEIVTILALLLTAFPCFAEIRCDRGEAIQDGIRYNAVVHWNDEYVEQLTSAQEWAEEEAERSVVEDKKQRAVSSTCHCYDISADESYHVILMEWNDGEYAVGAYLYGEDDYKEELYLKFFSSRSSAIRKFASLCKKYYKKIPR